MNTKNKLHGEAEVRTLLDGWAAAIRAKDSDAVLSHYASDLVQFDLAPPLEYSGKNTLDKQDLETWFSTFNGPIAYEIRNLKVTAGDEVAFCHSLNHLSGTKTTGERVDLWLRATAGPRARGPAPPALPSSPGTRSCPCRRGSFRSAGRRRSGRRRAASAATTERV